VKEKILTAFEKSCAGFSPDRVVADPSLNLDFINRCRAFGIHAMPVELNLALLNLRKAGLLKGRPRSLKTSFRNQSSYSFASEIAARHLEKRYASTLDRIICDPQLVAEFDQIASEIAPGFTSLQYRWAALNLRKARLLRPELLSQVVHPTSVFLGEIKTLKDENLPMQQGLYVFYGPTETLYVGEGINLRKRVAKHLDHSDNKNLARWFWSRGFKDVRLEIQVLADNTPTKVRKALEAELISTRHPVFNVQRLILNH
jgi:hypothetical protein